MAITNYTELQAAVGNWLNRSDLTSRIPEFIALGEAYIRRNLRERTLVGSLPMDVGVAYTDLPTTVKTVELLRYNTGTFNHALRPMSHAGLANIRRPGTGMPTAFAMGEGTNLHLVYFDVVPDQAYLMELVYKELIAPLSGGAPTNGVLTNSPDIYLYASLMAAAPYLEHDDRVPLWSAALDAAMAQENAYRDGLDIASGAEMALPVTFGEETGL